MMMPSSGASNLLRELWDGYSSSVAPQAKKRRLVQFLAHFVDEILSFQSMGDNSTTQSSIVQILEQSLGDLTQLAGELIWLLIDELAMSLTSPKSPPSTLKRPGLVQYLLGQSSEGEGAFLLWAIELLSNLSKNGKYIVPPVPGLASGLAAVISSLLAPGDEPTWVSEPPVAAPPHDDLGDGGHWVAPALRSEFYEVRLSSLAEQFSLLAAPASLGFLLTSLAGPAAAEVVRSTPFEAVCSHLLALLQQLLRHEALVAELVQSDRLGPLVEQLAARSGEAGQVGLVIVHRQVVRVVGCVWVAAGRSRELAEQVHARRLVSATLAVLRASDTLPSLLALELAQTLVYGLKRTLPLAAVLYDEFQQQDGHAVLAAILTAIGRFGTREEKVLALATVAHLLFLGPQGATAVFRRDTLSHPEGFRVLLGAYRETSSPELQRLLLRTMHAIFVHEHHAGYTQVAGLEPFRELFQRFDQLDGEARQYVLAMVDDVLARVKLGSEELRAECQLLASSRRPSTQLLVAKHLAKALQHKQVSTEQLRLAGLAPVLVGLLCPPSELPGLPLLAADPKEREYCCRLLLPGDGPAPADPAPADPADPLAILYKLCQRVLHLLYEFVKNNPRNQQAFRDDGALAKLCRLVVDEALRPLVLKVVALCAIADLQEESKIVAELLGILQAHGSLATLDRDVLLLRLHVLSTLAYILLNNPFLKKDFRLAGGFAWAVRVIDGMGRAVAAHPPPVTSALAHEVLEVALRTVAAALKQHPDNQRHFRDEVPLAGLIDALTGWRLFEGTHALPLLEVLLGIAVHQWPPVCSVHTLACEGDPCPKCRSTVVLEIPDIVKLLLALLARAAFTTPSSPSPASPSPASPVDAALHLLKSLSFIADILTVNLHTLSSAGIVADILDLFGPVLLAQPPSSTSTPSNSATPSESPSPATTLTPAHALRPALLELLQKVAAHSISLAELRKYLELLRQPSFPADLLKTLAAIARRPLVPSYFADFVNPHGAIEFELNGRAWPPARGFTFAFWMHITALPGKEVLPLFSFRTGHKDGPQLEGYISGRTVHVQWSSKDAHAFSEWAAERGQWYHVAVTCTPAKTSKKAQVKLSVNGVPCGVGTVGYPRATVGPVAVVLGASVQPLSAPSPAYSWQLGNALFIEAPATDCEAVLLYSLGPDYVGSLAVPLAPFQVYDHITEDNLRHYPPSLHGLLVDLATYSLAPLDDHLLFVFCCRSLVVAQEFRVSSGSTSGPPSNGSGAPSFPPSGAAAAADGGPPPAGTGSAAGGLPSTTASSLPSAGALAGSGEPGTGTAVSSKRTLAPYYSRVVPTESSVVVRTRHSVGTQLVNLGGASGLIYLLAMLTQREHQRCGLKLLYHVLQYQPRLVREMRDINGYELLSRWIRRNNWKVDRALLGQVFQLVGVSKGPAGSPPSGGVVYGRGVVANMAAFERLLLDWRVWRRGPLDVQQQLFGSLAELVGPRHELAAFNIARFREAGVPAVLLRTAQEEGPRFPLPLAPLWCAVLRALVTDPPLPEELSALFSFVLSTHPSSSSTASSATSSASSVLSVSPSSSATLVASATDLPTETSDASAYICPRHSRQATGLRRASSGSVVHLPTLEGPVRDDGPTSFRDYALYLMLDILHDAAQQPGMSSPGGAAAAITQLAESCAAISPPEVLFGMLHVDSISTRVALVKYMGVLLAHSPTFRSKFRALKGYVLLGHVLRPYAVSDDLVESLLGWVEEGGSSRAGPAPVVGRKSLLSWLPSLLRPSDTASGGREGGTHRRVGALKTLLLLIGGCYVSRSPQQQRRITRQVHEQLLQDDEVKGQFLRVSVAESLAEGMAWSLCHWLQLPRAMRPPEAFDGLLGLVKTAALHGLTTPGVGSGVLEALLVALLLHVAVVGREYLVQLRKRVLYDLLLFFFENDFRASPALLAVVDRVLLLAIGLFVWEPLVDEPAEDAAMAAQRAAEELDPIVPSDGQYAGLVFKLVGKLKGQVGGAVQRAYAAAVVGLLRWGQPEVVVAALDEAGSTLFLRDWLGHPDYIARLLAVSSKLLGHASEAVREATWRLWRAVLRYKGFPYRQKFFFPGAEHATSAPAEEDDVLLMDEQEVAPYIRQAEERDGQVRRQWQQEWAEQVRRAQLRHQLRTDRLREITHAVANALFMARQLHHKPLLLAHQRRLERDYAVHASWKTLVKRVTHERALWPHAEDMVLWKLDPTEGPMRMRKRLKRHSVHPLMFAAAPASSAVASDVSATPRRKKARTCDDQSSYITPEMLKKKLEQLAWLKKVDMDRMLSEDSGDDEHHAATVASPMESGGAWVHLKPGERLLSTTRCSNITPFSKRDGELLVGINNVYFVDEQAFSRAATGLVRQHTWSYEEIKELHKRRHLLKDNALELFLISGRTYLLAFDQTAERDEVYAQLMSMELPNRVNYEDEVQGNLLRLSITEKWQRGLVSNFEYLMHLNTLSGRTYNDLTQYPVMPWVLADYTSAVLDLNNPRVYRDLSRPMGAQDAARLEKFIAKYKQVEDMGEVPYYYGSHYSNSASALHFLVRLEPFSSYFIEFQGGRFDVADRLFVSVGTTWGLSSALSGSDVKELIPEFFFLPEFLMNNNRFDLGIRQNGERVDDVELPPWADGSPRKFIRIHRMALESPYVSSQLHHWIDLIFGYKQQGEHARKAFNVFHPLTYEGAVNVDAIEDPLNREATIAQISSYGQTPKQLFKRPHPERHPLPPRTATIFSSPELLHPHPMYPLSSPVGALEVVANSPVPLGAKKVLLYPEAAKVVAWGQWDQNLRVASLDTGRVYAVIETLHDDDILDAAVTKNGRLLVTGGTACVVKVWKRLGRNKKKEAVVRLKLQAMLFGHSAPVECVAVSQEFSLILSGSADGTCILWDLNRLSYVRSLAGHPGPVCRVAISPITGDILTVASQHATNVHTSLTASPGSPVATGGSMLKLWSINGELLSQTVSRETVTSVLFTTGIEGLSRNVIFGGLQSGRIKVWDAWDLQLICELKGGHKAAVSALAANADHTQLYSGSTDGMVVCWVIRSS